jgi:DNA-directed RNA polymerase II subunit RPB1
MSRIPTTNLHSVQFYVLGDDDNVKISSALVNKYDLVDNPINAEENSLNDLKMGTNSNSVRCNTCMQKKSKCEGHSGIMKLNYPIISPFFKRICVKWLNIICVRCGGLKAGKPSKCTTFKKYYNSVKSKISNGIECRNVIKDGDEPTYCNWPNPKISEDPNHLVAIMQTFYKKTIKKSDKRTIDITNDLMPREIGEILSRVTGETLKLLNVSPDCHPRKYVLNYIRVPPNTARPDSQGTGDKSDHNNITIHLHNIAEINQTITASAAQTSEFKNRVYNLSMAYYDQVIGKPAQQGEKVTVSIARKHGQKTGLIRKNLLGWRVRGFCRNFINAEPMLRLDHIGIPHKLTSMIDIKETVSSKNRNILMRHVLNGTKNHPGCKQIYKKRDGKIYGIDNINSDKLIIEDGDVVHRDMVDHDIIYFNRQPTLMTSNITAVRVRVMHDCSTIVMNPAICNFFNADFDGDAMNGWPAVDVGTSYEISKLASVGEHLIRDNGAPMIGQMQDSIIGNSELTKSTTLLHKYHAMNLFSNFDITPRFGDEVYSGRDIMSLLFKTTNTLIDYKGRAKYYNKMYNKFRSYNPDDINIKIEQGVHKTGSLDKSSIGKTARNGIYHLIQKRYGAKKTIDIMWYMQHFALKYLRYCGLTMGISDFLITEKSRKKIDYIGEATLEEVDAIYTKLLQGKIIAPPGTTIEEHYKHLVMAALDPTDEYWEPVHNGIDWDNNNLYKDINTGSRGGPINLLRISAAGGLQLVRNQILERDLDGRSSPYFTKDSRDPLSVGYVANSFMAGQNMAELVNACKASRDVLTVKTISTGVTGHQDRQSKQSLESIYVDNMRATRKRTKVLSPLFGGHGIDPRFIKVVRYRLFEGLPDVPKDELAQLKSDRDKYFEIFLEIEMRSGVPISDKCYGPVDVAALIRNIRYENPKRVWKKDSAKSRILIEKFLEKMDFILIHSGINTLPEHMKWFNTMFKILVRSELNSHRLKEDKLSYELVVQVLARIRSEYINSLEKPGVAQGIKASQGVNEPNTQSMLNAIHGTDRGGIKQFEETISVTRLEKMESAAMTIYMDEKIEQDREEAVKLSREIESLQLTRLISNYKIFYEYITDIVHPQFKSEQNYINQYIKNTRLVKMPSDLVNWCIRIEFDKMSLISKKIEVENVYCKLREVFPRSYIVWTPSNSDKMWMRIYMRQKMSATHKIANSSDVRQFVENKLLTTIISGVEGIIAAKVKERRIPTYDGKLDYKTVYTIETYGCNVPVIMMNPKVDPLRTYTTSVAEMCEHVGITAARNTVVDIMQKCIPAAPRPYVEIYADEMCSTGVATPINVHGSKKRKNPPLQLIGDQSAIDNTRTAAKNGARDNLYGCNAAFITSTAPKFGTLFNKLVVNTDYVANRKEKTIEDLMN